MLGPLALSCWVVQCKPTKTGMTCNFRGIWGGSRQNEASERVILEAKLVPKMAAKEAWQPNAMFSHRNGVPCFGEPLLVVAFFRSKALVVAGFCVF